MGRDSRVTHLERREGLGLQLDRIRLGSIQLARHAHRLGAGKRHTSHLGSGVRTACRRRHDGRHDGRRRSRHHRQHPRHDCSRMRRWDNGHWDNGHANGDLRSKCGRRIGGSLVAWASRRLGRLWRRAEAQADARHGGARPLLTSPLLASPLLASPLARRRRRSCARGGRGRSSALGRRGGRRGLA